MEAVSPTVAAKACARRGKEKVSLASRDVACNSRRPMGHKEQTRWRKGWAVTGAKWYQQMLGVGSHSPWAVGRAGRPCSRPLRRSMPRQGGKRLVSREHARDIDWSGEEWDLGGPTHPTPGFLESPVSCVGENSPPTQTGKKNRPSSEPILVPGPGRGSKHVNPRPRKTKIKCKQSTENPLVKATKHKSTQHKVQTKSQPKHQQIGHRDGPLVARVFGHLLVQLCGLERRARSGTRWPPKQIDLK